MVRRWTGDGRPDGTRSTEVTGSGPAATGGRTSEVGLVLDGVQQRLFAVALGLRRLRRRCARVGAGPELTALEEAVDDLIRDVRAWALTRESER
jgi:hypothetical protein